jgi:diaminohydroxyphosphoribosylaminopyrimidine deaminase/5-amino-6-(5-phosphoribosylamino)uracil reductase
MSEATAAGAEAEVDLYWMEAALNMGSRSLGLTAPNPSVGAILVKDRVVVGRGATAPGGGRTRSGSQSTRLAKRRAARRCT